MRRRNNIPCSQHQLTNTTVPCAVTMFNGTAVAAYCVAARQPKPAETREGWPTEAHGQMRPLLSPSLPPSIQPPVPPPSHQPLLSKTKGHKRSGHRRPCCRCPPISCLGVLKRRSCCCHYCRHSGPAGHNFSLPAPRHPDIWARVPGLCASPGRASVWGCAVFGSRAFWCAANTWRAAQPLYTRQRYGPVC